MGKRKLAAVKASHSRQSAYLTFLFAWYTNAPMIDRGERREPFYPRGKGRRDVPIRRVPAALKEQVKSGLRAR
jgi:hypothetical protein